MLLSYIINSCILFNTCISILETHPRYEDIEHEKNTNDDYTSETNEDNTLIHRDYLDYQRQPSYYDKYNDYNNHYTDMPSKELYNHNDKEKSLERMSSLARSGYGYGSMQSYGYQQQQYQPRYKPEKKHHKIIKIVEKKKIYIPVYKHHKKKKKKKKKAITKYKGFYIEGGSQIYGKFKSLKQCIKLCDKIPTCFAGDYNKWLKKCYIHTNMTACGTMKTNKKICHFKKIPCIAPETTRGRVTIGAHHLRGIEIKGIKHLTKCLQKCAAAGGGIAPNRAALHNVNNPYPQLCGGVDFDFSNYKCYFLTGLELIRQLCPNVNEPLDLTPNLVKFPSGVNIILCPPLDAP